LPDMNGIEVSRRILSKHQGVKIIIFSSDTSLPLVNEALQAGVCGYLSKTSSITELVQAVNAVMAGQVYLCPEVSEDILKNYQKGLLQEPRVAKPFLSDREKVLLRLVAEGHRNKEISVELKMSTKSVEAYRSRMMKKLGCSTSADLVRYAIREGLTTL
jgi:DNA-binding NarL/FixJ family response regulator